MARQNEQIDYAELRMIEAWQLLMRLPDRERGWLKSGHGMKWPAMVRDAQAEYADPDATPRPQLGRREMALVRLAWWQDDCLAEAVLPEHRALFALVIAIRAGRQPGGFKWEDVWVRFGGKRCGVTKEALRGRYEASLGRVAVRLMVIEGAGLGF